MTQEKLNSIKDRIAKLLAKAEGTDNPHEQELFMQKVNELLELHQIEMFEIRARVGFDNDAMGVTEGEFNVYASATWMKFVIHQIAMYYGATTVWYRNRNHMPYKVFGRESARITTELMLPFVISQVRQHAKQYAVDYNVTPSVAQRNVGMALSARITRMLAEAQKHRADLESRALVPVNDVDAFVKDFFGGRELKTGKKVKGYRGSAADYADKISINRQASHEKRKLLA